MNRIVNILLLIFLLFFSVENISAQSSPFQPVELLLEKSIYFDFGKYELRPDAIQTLQVLIDSCQEKIGIEFKVEAHTDHIGTGDNNLILSQKRSEAVKAYLSENGLGKFPIEATVYGENKPVADNESEAGRQQNRRAIITVFHKKKMTLVKGKVVDKKTGDGILAKVIFHTKTAKDSMMTQSDGSFEKPVEENTVLGVDIYKEGYFFDTQMLRAKANNLAEITIPLAPIAVGESVAIKNLYYVGNKAILLKSSEPELPKVLKFMQLNSKIKIEIEGHINLPFRTPEQMTKAQWDLSTNRAKLVYDFLLENNISKERMSFQGYGNKFMVYPKARDEKKQAMNRRVEIKIISTDVNEVAKQ